MTPQHLTFLRCSHRTAFATFLIIGAFFVFTGCAQVYKFLGLTEEQTQDQVLEDQQTIIRTVTQVRTTAADIITTTIAALGTIATALLAKWLGTERKITASMIGAVEHAANAPVKNAIKNHATAAGVENQLHARVKALT